MLRGADSWARQAEVAGRENVGPEPAIQLDVHNLPIDKSSCGPSCQGVFLSASRTDATSLFGIVAGCTRNADVITPFVLNLAVPAINDSTASMTVAEVDTRSGASS